MPHHTNVITPEGTPLIQRTVGELVAERPGRSRVFQSFAIDFCCQGGLTLEAACNKKNVALDSVVEQLEAEAASPAAPATNPAELPPHELAAHIEKVHHGFLKQELPRIHAMSHRVAQVHGPHTPSLVEVFQVFCGLAEEMVEHMQKEEDVIFPAISAMSRGEAGIGSLDAPLTCLIHEHEETGRALARLRELTNAFEPPAEACNTYRALFAGLADLEEDMQRHIHLENSVLFPAGERLAAKAA